MSFHLFISFVSVSTNNTYIPISSIFLLLIFSFNLLWVYINENILHFLRTFVNNDKYELYENQSIDK